MLNATTNTIPSRRTDAHTDAYERVIRAARSARWDIDSDVIRGRSFDFSQKFLPDGLSRIGSFGFPEAAQRRLMSQVQGRTYAYLFGLVERFIGAKMLELSADYALDNQAALEALVGFSGEEIKHQELFRRLETMMEAGMPPGFRTVAQPNDVARAVLGKSTWAVLALTCHIELFTQAHYKQSIEPDPELSPLWKDVFRYHWMEEARHAVLDELEWVREDRKLTEGERDTAVGDLIALVGAVDGILQAQSQADARYFVSAVGGAIGPSAQPDIRAGLLAAYRWQYILSGVQHPHFAHLLMSLTSSKQMDRIQVALAPLIPH